MSDLILVQIGWPEMKIMLEAKVHGVPVYWAFDDEGRCHTWPLSNWEEARAAERQRALEDDDLPPGLERA